MSRSPFVPQASSQAALHRMKRQRIADTGPELAIRSLLHRMGLRFRLHRRLLNHVRRTADISFIREKVAIFVDGCFWHGCPRHGTWPKKNADFWKNKILANKSRDRDTNRRLKQAGWTVIRIWEHESPETAAKKIAKKILQRRGAGA